MLSNEDFEFIARLLRDRSGLVVGADKGYLLDSRLMPVARKHGASSLKELVAALRASHDERMSRDVTEAMTTNESFFFRDIKPFDQFRDIVVPELLSSRAARRSFRIWSAACSSGQEAYSLAMILKEMGPRLAGWNIEIVGTDISTEMLRKAAAGTYTQFEVQRGLPIQMMVKHFKKHDEHWQISQEIRSMVQFREFNLLHDLRPLGQFDVVFCRNVLIYFDQETKSKVLDAISRQMPDDGILYLGGAESVLGTSGAFRSMPEQRGVYRVTARKAA
jgi:chemotaxis protein methyltransferase CheR